MRNLPLSFSLQLKKIILVTRFFSVIDLLKPTHIQLISNPLPIYMIIFFEPTFQFFLSSGMWNLLLLVFHNTWNFLFFIFITYMFSLCLTYPPCYSNICGVIFYTFSLFILFHFLSLFSYYNLERTIVRSF